MRNLEKEEYNSVPVFYCSRCLSLNIRCEGPEELDLLYCDDCGTTNIENTDIDTWGKMYQARYGHKLLETYN